MKRKSIIALLLACAFSFGVATTTACNIIGGPNDNGLVTDGEQVAVTGVTLSDEAVTLKKGGEKTLTATVAPDNATNKEVTWSSDKTAVATVDQKGKVKAVAAGTAVITVKTKDGNFTDTCTVTVQGEGGETGNVAVTGITVTPATAEITAGATTTLNYTISPTDATNKGVTWSSDNETVATVANGTVTAKTVGSAVITATTADGGFTDSCTVTVTGISSTVLVASITVSPDSATLNVGDTRTLTATVLPDGATNKEVTWSSNNVDVATVSNGTVTAKAAGTAVITATAKDGSGVKGSCNVTVKASAAKTYTVTFISDGTTVSTQTVEEGKCATIPANVTKEGYYVSGWGNGSATGANYDFTSKVTGNITLYAKWEKVAEGLAYSYAGNECAAFEWGDSNPAGATVKYKLSTESTYKTVDSQLVRAAATTGQARVDIVGLKGGANYDFEITTSSGKKLTSSNMQITAYDRSGYAHFKNTAGVGAYNDDGTLKSGANVYYVTEENKNNVDGNGKSIAELLTALKNSSTATVFRIIGTVKCPQYLSANNLDTSITDIDGIIRKDQGDDSYWNMIDITSVKNVTVEGIGEDATIFQFGFTWKKCSSIEVRNLTFTDYPEDACSFEGDTSSPTSYKYIWLHHSVFNIGKNGWDKTTEQDKHDGDGASDLKGVSNVTFSYLRYNGCHKTGLVGGDDTHKTCSITFHHNYYNGNQQRLPLGRQANMHMYNNYYYQSTMYSISLRANAYALIEYNYFDNTINKGTVEIRNSAKVENFGYGKLWQNQIVGKKGFLKNQKEFDGGEYIVEVSSRTQKVDNTNTFNKNFDTDSANFYYDAAAQKSDVTNLITDVSQIPELIPALAGVQKRTGTAGSGGEGGGAEEHQHTYADAYTSAGESGHYKMATCEHSTEHTALEPHVYDNDTDTTCNLCSYVRTVSGGGESGALSNSANVTGEQTANTVVFELKNGSADVAKVTLLVAGTAKDGGTLEESDGSTQNAEGHIQAAGTGALKFELAAGYTYTVTIYAGSSSTTDARTVTINGETQSTGIGKTCKALTWNLSAGTFTSAESGKIRIAKIVITATPVN